MTGGRSLFPSRSCACWLMVSIMTSRYRLVGTMAALTASTMALNACTSEDSDDQVVVTQVVTSTAEAVPAPTTPDEATESVPPDTAGTSAAAALAPVEPSEFSGFGAYSFDFTTGGTVTGYCVIATAGDSVTCSGTADASVLDVEGMFSGRPNAVILNQTGTAYTVTEGGPPPPRGLDTGEQMSLGSVTRRKPADDVLTCELGSNTIQIAGPDRRISTS